MLFHKFPHADNFAYPDRIHATTRRFTCNTITYAADLEALAPGVQRFTVKGGPWKQNFSHAKLFPGRVPEETGDDITGTLYSSPLELEWRDSKGRLRLRTAPGRTLGIAGEKFVMGFELDGTEFFYGMGEKYLGMELSKKRTQFWNTDAAGDFPHDLFIKGKVDPAYVSIPWVIIRNHTGWVGILVNNPGRVFMDTGAPMRVEGLMDVSSGNSYLQIGAWNGQPDLYVLFADTLPGLIRKFQHLVGTTPLPPAWSLGYHQCRWGYRSASDLKELKARFRREGIPVDGLWLDIDYMRGYRVFTFNDQHFPRLETDLAELQSDGQKVVPILDPGVKIDPDWNIYRSGKDQNAFCQNQTGRTFCGQVWPGDSAFVDYPQEHASNWWTQQVETFARLGIEGCWNDMNDPSVGFVDYEDMLWNGGKEPHWTYHNQFANGMVEATREGFLSAHPDRRPFLLSRSGYIGIGRHAAIWHGDSCSNDHWLRLAIPTALNLSLSGVPFNGPDLGGFALDTNARLFEDYHKACFLFPFCRNHTASETAQQEPWAFGNEVTARIRSYIRARYFLRPYLYQLFIRQEEQGDPILRPLFYDFPDSGHTDMMTLNDQFMIGSSLMQAPLVDTPRTRRVVLPPGRWWNFMTGRWINGGRSHMVTPAPEATPLYGRGGHAFISTRDIPVSNEWVTQNLDVHLLLEPETASTITGDLYTDDGASFAYQKGKRFHIRYRASVKNKSLDIHVEHIREEYDPICMGIVLYSSFSHIRLNGQPVKARRHLFQLAGREQKVWRL
ncbi:MAG: TIM-barrel domain-containing protein [Kiritimatiellia bacterium]